MKFYSVADWYWIVAGDTTRVYASARGRYVPVLDTAFVAWLDEGGVPSRIDTAANLGAVLSGQATRPTDATVLDGFTSQQAAGVTRIATFKVLFNHENRIRALEGKTPLNAAQAMAAVKALM